MRRIICDSCHAVLDERPHLAVRVDGDADLFLHRGLFLELCDLQCLAKWAQQQHKQLDGKDGT